MDFITWSENDSIKVEIIDKQHKDFFDIINELYLTLGLQKDNETKELLIRLSEEIKIHFDTEEKLMKNNKFGGYFSHKLEHDRFYNKLNQFRDAVLDEKDIVNLEFLNSLKRWFYNHIDFNDRKLGEYLNTLGTE